MIHPNIERLAIQREVDRELNARAHRFLEVMHMEPNPLPGESFESYLDRLYKPEREIN